MTKAVKILALSLFCPTNDAFWALKKVLLRLHFA